MRFSSEGSCDFNEEGHRLEPAFEAIKRVMSDEEHRWITLIEGSADVQWRKRNTKNDFNGKDSATKRKRDLLLLNFHKTLA